jgi:hypothetical protein
MTRYRTFKRSCRNWKEFGSARKITDQRGLTYEEAFMRCQEWNKDRTPAQVNAGTKLEFEKEDT